MPGDILWRPNAEIIAASNLKAFMDRHGLADYDALLKRADAEPEWFWDAVAKQAGLRFYKPYEKVLDLSEGPAWAKWYVGGTTNLTLNLLERYRGTPTEDAVAIAYESETGETRQWTYRELDREVCRLAAGLKSLGIGRGDAVGVFMPMLPEVAAAFLAVAHLGAICVPLFSGFGAQAIATRLNDAGAKAAITVDATRRRGSLVPMKATLDQAAAEIPGLRHIVVLDALRTPVEMRPGRDVAWRELVEGRPDRIPAEEVPAEHPLLLVYTSGTTGRPKGAVLSHIGVQVRLALDFHLCFDFKPADRLVWMSDFGWVVGPMTISAPLLAGGSILLAEGVPDYPEPGRLWRLVQDHKVSFIGIAPTAVRSLMRYGPAEAAKYDLGSLRVAASTGEPWTEEAWLWFFEHVCKRRVPIMNWSGGTEVGGGILAGTLLHPQKACSFAGAIPGTGADILDEAGNSVPPGQVGELVMRAPSPGLTMGLWKDPERYIETYWSLYPGVWRHGDWASRDEDGMWYVHGRSDDTIKVSGKRTGPAEIEGLVMATGKVSEAAAVGVPDPRTGEAVAVVCVPAPGVTGDGALAETLSGAVAAGFGKSFRPKHILFVPDLPKTRNMKIMRRVVRAALLGKPPGDLTALVNPEAVEGIERLPDA